MNDSLLNDLEGGTTAPKHYLPVSAASQGSFTEDTALDVSHDINAEVRSKFVI
jgi:hypothetical protein